MFSRTAVEASVRHCLQIFSAFLLFTLQTNVHAQSSSVIFEHFSTDQGKFSPIVRCILQDRLGFLWFATYGGLDRYDGNTFVSYKHDPTDRYSIDNSWGLSLCEDTKGFLWVGTWRGLEKFDRATEKFYHFIPHPRTDTEWGNVVFAVHEDREGVLWVGTGDGLYFCNRPNDTTVTFENAMDDSARPMNKAVRAITEDRLGRIWVASESNLMELDRVSRRFVCRWRLPDRPNGETEPAKISQHWIFAIHEDHEGTLWLATNGGLVRYDVDSGTSLIYRHHLHQRGSLNDNGVLAVGEDAVGQIWAGTDYGLDRLDRATGTFTTFRHSDKDLSGLRANGIYQIYSERSGTLWISTRGGGVGRLNPNHPLFTSYNHPEKGSGNFTGGLVEMASGTIWANTYFNGIQEFDTRKGTFKHLGPRTAFDILAKGAGSSVWIAPGNGGLGIGLLEKNGSVIPFNDSLGRASSNMVDGMCHSQHGFYWVVTDHGLCKMEPKTRSFTYVSKRQLPPRFMNVFEDATGVVWIGTMELGLYSYEPANDSFTHFAYDWKNPGTISGSTIAGVIEDTTAGVLWLATTFGLNKFDKHTRMFTRFTSKNGLPHDNIVAMLMDGHGNLWLSTLGGITRFDPRTKVCRNFDESDGLPSGRFSYGNALKTRNGEMYFGNSGGLVRFHPDSIRESSYVPPIVITAFRKSDTLAVLDSAIFEKKVIDLSYKDRVFSFEFSALNYSHLKKNQYAYKLEGFDPNWVYCGTRRTATYTNLDGGSYIFRVKGSNNDGIWNEAGTSLALIITPPFWATWWFRGFAFIAMLVSVGASVRYVEMRKLKRRIEKLEQERAVERERIRISQDMHDEVGASLTEIAILSELAKTNLREASEAQPQIQKIAERSRQVVDNIGEIIWAINPKNDMLEDLLSYIRHYSVQYFEMTSIRCHCEIPEVVPEFHLSAEARRNIFLVVKEVLHNVVKHSKATEAAVQFTFAHGKIEIRVQDNGKGFALDGLSRFGNGLTNMRKRIEDIGGTFAVQSQPGCGTKVVISAGL